MKNIFLLLFLFAFSIVYSQTPHITGSVSLSVKKGTIECDFVITDLPSIKDYGIWLNTGFNIAAITDSTTNVKYHWEKSYNNKSDEAFQYGLIQNDDSVKTLPKTLHIHYTGAFPVISDTAKMYDVGDWKGNIAFNGTTLRMTEQSAWYPVIYDKRNDVILSKYTYSIQVACDDGAAIYVNGDTPKTGTKNLFSSPTPVALLLFAGQYTFKQEQGIYFINTDLSADEIALLSKWSNKVISFYSSKLKIPYGSPIFYLSATPVTKDNVWLFVTYPTIAMVGRQLTMHDLFTKTRPLAVDTSNIPFIAHEIGHYYFGTLFEPNTALKWAFLEGFTEYFSLQFVRQQLGEDTYKKTIKKYAAAVANAKNLTPLNKVTEIAQSTEVFKYRYVPLLLVALEKSMGQEKMWRWFASILRTQNATTNYAFFKNSLLHSGMDEASFRQFEDRFITDANAIHNLTETVSE